MLVLLIRTINDVAAFEKKDSLLSQQPFSNLIHCNIESREDKIANSPIS